MIIIQPASMGVLARLGAPAQFEWELLCFEGVSLLVDRHRTCYFEGMPATASGEAELAIVGDELHVRLPFACLRFDRRLRRFI